MDQREQTSGQSCLNSDQNPRLRARFVRIGRISWQKLGRTRARFVHSLGGAQRTRRHGSFNLLAWTVAPDHTGGAGETTCGTTLTEIGRFRPCFGRLRPGSFQAILTGCGLISGGAGWRGGAPREDEDQMASGAALVAMAPTLLGTSGCWFLYDISNYGVGIFTTAIFPSKPGLDTARLMVHSR